MASKTDLSKRKLKGAIDCLGQTEKNIIKKDATKSSVGIKDIKSDPNRLNSLTVKELRTITRSVGISSRGSKKELISALKGFSFENETVIGNSPSLVETVVPESMPSEKAESSLFSVEKQKKNKRKQEVVECNIVEDESTAVVVKQKKSTSNSEVIEIRSSKSSRKVSTSIQSSESVAGEIGLPLPSGEPWTVLAHKKPQRDWKPYTPNTMRPPPLSRDTKFVKLMSWNVNGLRALLKLESFSALQLAQKEDFDVLCLQETKIQEKDVEEIRERLIDGYDHSFWTCSVAKLGYSGTAIISRIKPISVKYGLGISDHDSEGRLVTVEFDSFYLLCAYVPNSGDGLRRLTYRVEEWDRSLGKYMKELEKSKPVILTGDLNCAHEEIDIFNPAGNTRSAGFTIEERESFEKNFLSRGFVDTFRKQHPGVVAYTYWGYRHGGRKTNKGWRLDYFLVSESISNNVHDSYILPEVLGSDHCPIGLILKA